MTPTPTCASTSTRTGPGDRSTGFAQGYADGDRISELIDLAEVEIDEPTREGYYSELQELLYEDPMWVIAAQEGLVMAHGDWVQGFTMNPLWPRPSLKFALMSK